MKQKLFLGCLWVMLTVILVFGLISDYASAGTRLANEEILKEFKLALAASLEELIEFELGESDEKGEFNNGELVDIVRTQRIKVAKKEYIVVYLIREDGPRQLIWGIPLNRLKKLSDIRKCAQEAAEAIIYEVFYADAENEKQPKKTKNNISTKREAAIASLFFILGSDRSIK